MKKVIPLTIAALAMCSSALAQYPPSAPKDDSAAPAKVTFEALDTNKDGVISPQEAKASSAVSTSFATADKNKDGMLSKSEFDAYFS